MKIKREAIDHNLKIKKYKINGKPTCLAWYGGLGIERMACPFYGETLFKAYCTFTGEKLHEYEGTLINKPCDNCSIWREADEA